MPDESKDVRYSISCKPKPFPSCVLLEWVTTAPDDIEGRHPDETIKIAMDPKHIRLLADQLLAIADGLYPDGKMAH
jgi:hypothetical protein